jgi:uncharacterized protein YbjT (DUF2867 family)
MDRRELLMERILVVGGTGLLGRPVARHLLGAGFTVRLLVRDRARAAAAMGPGFEYVEGAVQDREAVHEAVRGCAGVHVSLGAATPAALEMVEHHGTAVIAQAAADHGVRLLSYVTGSLVHARYPGRIPEHRAKLAAEAAIRRSGVPFVFFRPTYVIDNLPRHIRGRVAVALGRPQPLHMVAAADLAGMVGRAFTTPGVANHNLYVHGPQAISVRDALRIYCTAVEPGNRVISMPIRVMSAVDLILLGGRSRTTLQLIALLNRLGEQGDPAEAARLVGPATTTVQQWCQQRAAERTPLTADLDGRSGLR